MRAASLLEESWLRPTPSRDSIRRDALLAAALLVAGLLAIEVLRSTPGAEAVNERLLECYLWSAAITAPLALRRVYPVAVMVVCSVAFYGVGSRVPVASGSIVIQAALFMAIYAAWAWSRHRRRLLLASALVVLGMFVWLAQLIAAVPATADTPGLVSAGVAIAVATLAINVVYFFGAIAWGLVSYRDAHRRQLLVEQAEALRREQERNAERAVAEDRLRIARDLHDAVAHHVTGIGVQAAAARHVLDRDPASSRTALEAIERSSRSAVHEMHQIVGLLRDEDSDEPVRTPGIAALATLALDAASDRLAVRYREVGDPFDVPDPVSTSVFRTAQEALTNVRRHSTAREAEMVLRYLDLPGAGRAVEVEVLDDGIPANRSAPTGRRGFGLQGLRERAAVHDAEADIGPRPEGGFRVRVRFPVPQVAHEAAR
jgi:signal transduction histidine kinase